ncbi:MAG: CPBP family intramembrane glutamic endopeptidase [Caldilinea sp.]
MQGRSFRTIFFAVDDRLRAGYRIALFFLLWGYGPAIVHSVLENTLLRFVAPEWFWLQGIALNLLRMAIIFAAGWAVARYVDRRPFADYGFHLSAVWWIDFCFGLLLGAALMALVFLVEWLAGWITIVDLWRSDPPGMSFGPAFLAAFILYLVVAIAEELLTRGNQMLNIVEGMSSFGYVLAVFIAWIISSVIFGLLHIFNPHATLTSTTNLMLMGFMFGLGFALTGELALPIGLHFTWNLVQGNVYGFPVSGKMQYATSFIAINQHGPELWTGGAFGPEAGLLGILATVAGMMAIVGWVRWRYGNLSLRRLHVRLPA